MDWEEPDNRSTEASITGNTTLTTVPPTVAPKRLRLGKNFYSLDCDTVCKAILGKILVRVFPDRILSGKIVEVEAYLGVEDEACHAYQGKRTEWNNSMYLEPGYSYVYQRFKKLHCFNISTTAAENPCALLIRGIEPLEGVAEMKEKRMAIRKNDLKTHQICSGPAKICEAMSITLDQDGFDTTTPGTDVYVTEGWDIAESDIIIDKRIRIDYAGEKAVNMPLRFSVKNSNSISVPPNTRHKASKRQKASNDSGNTLDEDSEDM